MAINDDLQDFQIIQAVALLRLSNQKSRELISLLSKSDQRVKRFLQTTDLTDLSNTRISSVRRKLRTLHESLEAPVTTLVTRAASEVGREAADAEVELLRRTVSQLPRKITINAPTERSVTNAVLLTAMLGDPVRRWVQQFNQNDSTRVERAVQTGITANETSEEVVRRTIGTGRLRLADGAREVSRRGAKTLMRTVLTHAASLGRLAVWTANPEVVDKYRWVSTLDSRTSPICRHRDGRMWEIGKGPLPPAHANCRSTTVAITKSWRELGFDRDEVPVGTRASFNGQVPADLTYFDWLARQSRKIQETVLGPTRLKLWKEGGIAPEAFQNRQGHLFTLEELRSLRPEAFQSAGI